MGTMAPQSRCHTQVQGLSFKSSVANRAAFVPAQRAPQRLRIQTLQIENALTRQRKEETVDKLVPLLQQSTVVVGLRYQGLTVKQVQDFKRTLPKDTKLIVCKNTLMRRAADAVEGWEELKPATKGDNAWLFIQEESIAESVKAYVAFEKTLLEKIPKEERDGARPLDVSGGVMQGKPLNYAEVKRLEKMPTKLQLIATLARTLNQVHAPCRLFAGQGLVVVVTAGAWKGT